ncbi:MAG: molybdenum cofactor guanylyltransferase MobA, partial [Pseudomonadota bacterium]
ALADDLAAALGDGVRKVLHWTDRHGTTPVSFPLATINGHAVDPFFNVNTPEDLAEAARIAEAAA